LHVADEGVDGTPVARRTLDVLLRFFRALREVWVGLMMLTTST
jgi:hypothetical protein